MSDTSEINKTQIICRRLLLQWQLISAVSTCKEEN